MKIARRIGLILLGFLVVLVLTIATFKIIGEPFMVFSGHALKGIVRDAPETWEQTQGIWTVQLETRRESPYSVNLWGVHIEDRFYITGNPDSTWVSNLNRDAHARLRVDGILYEVKAEAVTSDEERKAVAKRIVEKYKWEDYANNATNRSVFRLTAR